MSMIILGWHFLETLRWYLPQYCIVPVVFTTPVTVPSAERSFSKVKLIKKNKHLQSTMGDNRLSELAIISIENEMVLSINCDKVFNTFALTKSWKNLYKSLFYFSDIMLNALSVCK